MFRLGLLALALSTAALAQQNVPGTFTSASPEHVVPDILPLVQTPTMTLSNGFEPARVTMPNTMVSERPNMVVGSETMPQGEGMSVSAASEPSPADFNFAAVDIASAYNFSSHAPSLAAIARRLNKGHVQPHKTYTNDDIQKLDNEAPQNGIISATFANGQPIVAKNENGFNPASGIANLPDATTGETNRTEMANDHTSAPAAESQGDVVAGQETTPTAPSANPQQPANQQLPASDTNPR